MAHGAMPLLGLALIALADAFRVKDSQLLSLELETETLPPITVCYFTNWARYRSGMINTGKDVFEMDLDGTLCTHYMYGFVSVTQDFQLKASDPNADHPSGHAGQDRLCPKACNDPNFKVDWSIADGERCDWPCSPTRVLRGFEGMTVGMKRKNPSSKALISVGGWSFNDCAMSLEASYGQGTATCEIFSTIAASETATQRFAQNVITYCRKWGFDGFDLDWEYPVAAGHNSNAKPYVDKVEDYTNYIRMLRVMKEEFNKENPTNPLLLTAAVGVGKSTADTSYNIPEMNKHLDLINLMTYDLHGGWESRVGCNANLFATDEDARIGGGVGAGVAVAGYPLSVAWAVDYWLQKGASPSKLTMGLGTYGRGWKLTDPRNTAYNAPANGSCAPGASTKEAGYRAYYEVMDLLKSGQATRYYDNERQCPYVVTTDGEWIGYDDPQSLVAKVNFLKQRGLRGAMVWALDLDDFSGSYGGGKYPLMNAIRKALGDSGSGVVSAPVPPAPLPAPTTTKATTTAPAPLPAATTTKVTTTAPAKATTTTKVPLPTTTKVPLPTTTTATTTTKPTTSPVRPAPTPAPAQSGPTPAPMTGSTCKPAGPCTDGDWCDGEKFAAWCAQEAARSICPTPWCKSSVDAPAPVTVKTTPAPTTTAAPAPTPATRVPVATTAQPVATTTATKAGGCSNPALLWGQCGGEGWAGAKCCEAGTSCIVESQWYHQCKPGTQPVPAPSTQAPAPSTPAPLPAMTTTAKTTTKAPVPAPTPTPTPATTTKTTTKAPTPAPVPSTGVNGTAAGLQEVLQALSASNAAGVFMYDTGAGWLPSDLYTWPDMIKAVEVMAAKGVGSAKLWLGAGANFKYGLVNIAAFLAQCMQETIQYNACDENNWSDKNVVAEAGGSTYSSTAACGQLHQSYQDYSCSAEEDALAGGNMACEDDPNLEMRATTQAKWYGAPPALFCAPKSKVPKAPRWDFTAPWCPPPGGYGYEAALPKDVPLNTYWAYVNKGGSCKDYDGIKTGGWKFDGEGCVNGACPGSPAPLFGVPQGRTDVEGCCWWGRGVIQTTGTCNFGKLNYFMGARAAKEGRHSIYPNIDFCKNPGAICEPGGPGELKWVAGFFYWLNAVQTYSSGGWNYINELKKWVDGGHKLTDNSFINGASGIVNRGCHNPPNCGTGELHGGPERINNFAKVLKAMKLA